MSIRLTFADYKARLELAGVQLGDEALKQTFEAAATAVDASNPVIVAQSEDEIPALLASIVAGRKKAENPVFKAHEAMLATDSRVAEEIKVRRDGNKIFLTGHTYDPARKPDTSFWRNIKGYWKLGTSVNRINKLKRDDLEGFDTEFRHLGTRIIKAYGLEVEIEGLENLNPGEAYLLAPTHTSEAEFCILAAALAPLSLGYLAKDSFKKYPGYGSAMTKYEGERFFFIDRGNAGKARDTVSQIVDQMSKPDNPISVVYYAQGTRAEGRKKDGKRQDGDIFARGALKNGIAHTALDIEENGKSAKIVPITIMGVGEVKPRGALTIEGNRQVKIVIGKPIDPAEYAGSRAERVHDIMHDVEVVYRQTYAAPVSQADAKLTIETMRKARLGPWLINSLKGRILKPWKKNEFKAPNMRYLDQAIQNSAQELKAKQADVRAKDYDRVGLLFHTLRKQQSAAFNAFLDTTIESLKEIKRSFVAAFDSYVEKRQGIAQPDFASYSQAIGDLHLAISKSDLFEDKDKDLRIWSFYTMQAKDHLDTLKNSGASAEEIQKAQATYYRLFARGTRYAILNQAQVLVGKEGNQTSVLDWVKSGLSPSIKGLRKLGEQVELATELLIAGKSIQGRLQEVQESLDKLAPKYGKGIKGLKNTAMRGAMSYDGHRYLALKHEHELLEDLSHKMNEGEITFDQIKKMAGSEYLVLSALDETKKLKTLLAQHPDVAAAYTRSESLKDQWEGQYKDFLAGLINDEMSLYATSFKVEFEVHQKDGELQRARYLDLMQTARNTGKVTQAQEERFTAALGEYDAHLKDYLDAASDMASDGKTKEFKRKGKELDLFFKWLNLHWAASDTLKEVGHKDAGYIRLVSAMFPNQVEFLNKMSSKEFEGLRPIFEAMTFKLLKGLYFESTVGPNDPRQLDRVMGTWGLDATRRAVEDVVIVGAAQLVGAFGQSSGADLFEMGKSILTREQTELGVIPQTMGISANHQGFSDYTFVVGLMSALGFGRNWVVYETRNFDPFPVLSPALAGGDGIGFERDSGGSSTLQAGLALAYDRGVSPTGFDHGTRRMATAPNPLNALNPLADFIPREFILGGSLAEIGESARRAGKPFIPTLQIAGRFNHDPDLPLSGKIGPRFMKETYSVHQGAPMGGKALLAYGDPVAASVLPATLEGLRAIGIHVPADADDKWVSMMKRKVIAAHTEAGRVWAYVKALNQEGGLVESRPIIKNETKVLPASDIIVGAGDAIESTANDIVAENVPPQGAVTGPAAESMVLGAGMLGLGSGTASVLQAVTR